MTVRPEMFVAAEVYVFQCDVNVALSRKSDIGEAFVCKKIVPLKKAAWFYLLMRFVQLMVLRHKSICIVCSQRAADSVECLRVTMWSS